MGHTEDTMPATIDVRPARSKGELNRFALFPWDIYRGKFGNYDKWVPPLVMDEKHQLDRSRDPVYRHSEVEFFLAYRGGEVVGRVAAIIDFNFVEYQKRQAGYFGFFESVDDHEVARALVDAAAAWLSERGMEEMIGPINLSPNAILGMLIDNFETPPVIKMGYNPPYYPALMEGVGLRKEVDLYSYTMTTEMPLSDKIRRVQEISRKRNGFEIRAVSKKELMSAIESVRVIWNRAWADNWGFVPWTPEEFAYLAKDLELILMPELTFLAYIGDEPVGFALPIPDFNEVFIRMNGRLFPTGLFKLLSGRKKIHRIRIAAFGVNPEHRNKGIDAAFVYELYTRGVDVGITGGDFSWILEKNLPLRNFLEQWGCRHYKTHRIYHRALTGGQAESGPDKAQSVIDAPGNNSHGDKGGSPS